ncbi:MAG: V-type ATP synthase subunit B [Candidatus Brockarchaeota archaeon]|nr:V-type ATP synthase subunit B [Candidatus Brockarchaeota archaeon]
MAKSVRYRSIVSVNGPLIIVDNVQGVKLNEIAEIDVDGETRIGQVIGIEGRAAVIQVLQGTTGVSIGRSYVRFTGDTLKVPVSEEVFGRILNGLGNAIDGGPNVIGEKFDVNGYPINPVTRLPPRDFIQTGISAIDGLMSLIRGQKLPVFSGYGLPHNMMVSQVIRQAKLLRRQEPFAIVFATLGVSSEEASFFRMELERARALNRTVFILNLQSDSTVERIIAPRVALTIAEYLAFEKDYHVLVVMSDMSNYCEALRELSLARGEIPGRRGYPGYMYTDLATIYERAGLVSGRNGSLTQMPVLSMPDDDITHPIPDLTGYITEGQIVLNRNLHLAGVYPPVNVLASLSRLMKDGVGERYTRKDHFEIYTRLLSAYAEGSRNKELSAILGEETLTSEERKYVRFTEVFEKRFIKQGAYEERSIDETLNLGLEVLSVLK